MGGGLGRFPRAGKGLTVGRCSRAGEVPRVGRFPGAQRAMWGFE